MFFNSFMEMGQQHNLKLVTHKEGHIVVLVVGQIAVTSVILRIVIVHQRCH